MTVTIHFFSYFKDLAGCNQTREELPPGSSLAFLQARLFERFPQLVPLKSSTLIAVGVEYQQLEYLLSDGDEVSFFPPVQGG